MMVAADETSQQAHVIQQGSQPQQLFDHSFPYVVQVRHEVSFQICWCFWEVLIHESLHEGNSDGVLLS